MSINKFLVTGRLTNKEMKTFGQNGKVMTLSVAVDNRQKDNVTGQWVDASMPMTFEVFNSQARQLADHCERLQIGQTLFLEGRFKVDQWTDRNTNQPRHATKHVVENVSLIGVTQGNPEPKQAQSPPAPAPSLYQSQDNDPF